MLAAYGVADDRGDTIVVSATISLQFGLLGGSIVSFGETARAPFNN